MKTVNVGVIFKTVVFTFLYNKSSWLPIGHNVNKRALMFLDYRIVRITGFQTKNSNYLVELFIQKISL
jgi:hypothetical protein